MIFSLVAMTELEKMLHNICISAVAMSLRWATRDPWASCLLLLRPTGIDVHSWLSRMRSKDL